MPVENTFHTRVQELVREIPYGRVMTYGQIAALCGNARAARIVGGIAHYGDTAVPWHRVVNKSGGLAAGYYGGREGHKKALEAEGIQILGTENNYYVDIESLIWKPEL